MDGGLYAEDEADSNRGQVISNRGQPTIISRSLSESWSVS